MIETLPPQKTTHFKQTNLGLVKILVLSLIFAASSTASGQTPAEANDLTSKQETYLQDRWQQFDRSLHEELQSQAVDLAARRFGTSPQRALYQLAIQRNLADLRAKLFNKFPDSYTDARIDHQNNARITTYATTVSEELKQLVSQWLKAHSLAHHGKYISYEATSKSLEELKSVKTGIFEELRDTNTSMRPAATSID
jgi:hypothetical protein